MISTGKKINKKKQPKTILITGVHVSTQPIFFCFVSLNKKLKKKNYEKQSERI